MSSFGRENSLAATKISALCQDSEVSHPLKDMHLLPHFNGRWVARGASLGREANLPLNLVTSLGAGISGLPTHLNHARGSIKWESNTYPSQLIELTDTTEGLKTSVPAIKQVVTVAAKSQQLFAGRLLGEA